MFRVTRDLHLPFMYIHKKFLWWWIKYPVQETNRCISDQCLYKCMKEGHYDFSSGEDSNYWYITDETLGNGQKCTISYYKDAEDFRNQHVEDFI